MELRGLYCKFCKFVKIVNLKNFAFIYLPDRWWVDWVLITRFHICKTIYFRWLKRDMFFMTEDYALVKKNNVIIIFGFQCVCYYFLKGQKAIRKMLESEARDRRHATKRLPGFTRPGCRCALEAPAPRGGQISAGAKCNRWNGLNAGQQLVSYRSTPFKFWYILGIINNRSCLRETL